MLTYNDFGNITSEVDSMGNAALFFYDAAGNLVKAIRPEQAKDIASIARLSGNNATFTR